jgi:hypothetical protein
MSNEQEMREARIRDLEDTRRYAEYWLALVDAHKFNNKPSVGYAINRAKEKVDRAIAAALATEAQGGLPVFRITERYDEGWRVNGKWFDHQPTEAEVNEAYAAPAPSLCTAEEAAELAREHGVRISLMGSIGGDARVMYMNPGQLAAIINADRAKR